MNDKPISCTIKGAVNLNVDVRPGIAQNFNSGCKIIDISFPSIINPEIGEIHFQNSYVAFITLKVKIKVTEATPKHGQNDQGWKTAIHSLKLMPDPHAETGAQDLFCLTRKHFSCDLSNVVFLRLILQQPSPMWKDFNVQDIKIFRTPLGSRAVPFPHWITEEAKNSTGGKKEIEVSQSVPKSTKGVPDLDALSSKLQQLWALAEEASSNQPEESLGRYEVDGCYDINLLSYT
ncbi:unnamed protein product [Lymnaea stagnalis]|uniref:Nicolin-1 n=1 Tax=Lymnaea stagnalis TaxID=6523 RepID=A0AAV2I1R5_LYMST